MHTVVALLLTSLFLGPALSQSRRQEGQVVQSALNPAITVRVDPSLPFLGRTELDIRGQARAEQFYFADVKDGKLGRTVIVHFEHFLPTNDRTFGYPTFRMVRLGAHDYLHQTWPVADFGMFAYEPVKEMLAARGITAERGWLVNRYARVVDDAQKHELLLFYLEPGSSAPVALEGLAAVAEPTGVPLQPGQWATIAAGLAERARAAISVEDK
jgi:hypothetical protein